MLLSRLYGAPLAADSARTSRLTSPPTTRHTSRNSHLSQEDGPAAPHAPLLAAAPPDALQDVALAAVAAAAAVGDASRAARATASFSRSNPNASRPTHLYEDSTTGTTDRAAAARAIEDAVRAAARSVVPVVESS